MHGGDADRGLHSRTSRRPPPVPCPAPVHAAGSVAHFALLAPLGAGGMGIVWRARDRASGREVALKLLPSGAATDARAVERFRREARAAAALSHPNIVGLHEVGEAAEGWYIAMELVDGTTLGAARGTRWPVVRAVDVLRQCALALAAAHDAGIVHRDIKPDNVMLRDDGFVKLVDFGLARLSLRERVTDSGHSSGATGLSEPGLLVGTMAYVSPEQACGEPVGPPTDVFSLGILAYELLVGEHPFASPSALATMGAIITRTPLAPAMLRPELPPALDALVQRMLAKGAAERPTAAQVAEALRAIAADADSALPLVAGLLERPHHGAAAPLKRTSGVVVGRARDVAGIVAAYGEVVRGEGLLVSVGGEPGIGKTTLVESALAELARGDVPPIVARGRCAERLAGAEAYLPILDALEAAIEHDATGAVRTLLLRTAPSWATLLGRDGADAGDAAGVLASQERLKREMAALLEAASRRAPVALFLDDLHWADASTIDLLAYLGARLDRMRLLVLATCREAELQATQHPFVAVRRELAAHGRARELGVAHLDADDVVDYVARTYPGHGFPAAFARAVHARTGGNPLFVADVLRWLGARGIIAEQGGRWVLVHELEAIDRELPASARSMIERRLALLDDGDRRLLAAAAVQGAAFDAATVAAMVGAPVADVEEQLMVLDRVWAFVRRTDEGRYPDGSHAVRYRFVHALYLDALVEGLAPSRRAAWSVAAAAFLEARHGAQVAELAAPLAALHEAGRQPAQAARWYGAAAQRAMGVFAYAEAEALARRGLDQALALPDDPARAALELGPRLVLGAAALVRRGFAAPSTAEHMGRARELCEALGDAPALAPALWVLVLYGIASGALDDAAARSAQLLAIGEASGDPVIRAVGHVVHVGLALHRGRLREVRRHHFAAEALATPAVDAALRQGFPPDPLLTMRATVARQRWLRGHPDEAARLLDDLVARTARHGDPQGAAFVSLFRAELALVRDDPAGAEAIAREAIARCEEHDIASERLWNTAFLGAALAAQGRHAEGIALLRGATDAQLAIGSTVTVPWLLALLGAAELAAGDVAAAQATATRGLALAARTGEHAWDGGLWQLQAAILDADPAACGGALDAAGARARAAQAVEATGARAFAARLVGAAPITAG